MKDPTNLFVTGLLIIGTLMIAATATSANAANIQNARDTKYTIVEDKMCAASLETF